MVISPDSHSATSTPNRGQHLVLAMFAIAILAATFAWGWNYSRGRQALTFYGPEGATLIRTAPTVEILQSEPQANLDISQAPGLINARASLLSDASYEWSAPAPPQKSPLFSVRFKNGDRVLTVTFDFENRTLTSFSSERTVKLVKKTADGWQSYLSRQIKVAPQLPAMPPAQVHTVP